MNLTFNPLTGALNFTPASSGVSGEPNNCCCGPTTGCDTCSQLTPSDTYQVYFTDVQCMCCYQCLNYDYVQVVDPCWIDPETCSFSGCFTLYRDFSISNCAWSHVIPTMYAKFWAVRNPDTGECESLDYTVGPFKIVLIHGAGSWSLGIADAATGDTAIFESYITYPTIPTEDASNCISNFPLFPNQLELYYCVATSENNVIGTGGQAILQTSIFPIPLCPPNTPNCPAIFGV